MGIAAHLVALSAALGLAIGAAASARAQSPEKFERVVPAKPPATAPAPQANLPPLAREAMRKARAGESGDGFCATVPQQATPEAVFFAKPAGTAELYRSYSGFIGADTCGYKRIAAVFAEKGKRCVHMDIWGCYGNSKACFAERQTFCDSGSGSYSLVRYSKLK